MALLVLKDASLQKKLIVITVALVFALYMYTQVQGKSVTITQIENFLTNSAFAVALQNAPFLLV